MKVICHNDDVNDDEILVKLISSGVYHWPIHNNGNEKNIYSSHDFVGKVVKLGKNVS